MSERTIGLIGARGYVGQELLPLIDRHPRLRVAWIGARSNARDDFSMVPEAVPVIEVSAENVADLAADLVVLAVPNGAAKAFADALDVTQCRVLDISADHRFDADWRYGLPERFRDRIAGARRVANPGCYATGAELALLPVLEQLDGQPAIFGVSGYSGAGRTPSVRNDSARLKDNLLPYGLTGHGHEQEISHQLAHRVRFLPHVGPFFRGISLTISGTLKNATSAEQLHQHYRDYYDGEPRVRISAAVPEIRDIRNSPDIAIGGFSVRGREFALVATLDNLLKGAASQAMQNINLILGIDECAGIG